MSKSLNILKKLTSFISKNNSNIEKTKILGSLSLVVGSKYLNLQVPLYLKEVVNTTDNIITNTSFVNTDNINYLILGYGVCKISAYGFQELRNILFTSVSDNTIRNVSKNTVINTLKQSIDFHNNNKIGIITTTILNGSKGIRYLLNSVIFNILPLTLEIILVSNLLLNNYNYKFTLITLSTVILYSTYTISITQWRSKFLKNKIKLEKESNSILTDILINYENIKYFNSEIFESNKFEKSIKNYQIENEKIFKSLSLLNFGQNFIFSSALTLTLYLSYNEVISANMSIGDIILINGLLLQLITPLNFLGSMYRDTNQAIIDCENMFGLIEKRNESKKVKYQNYILKPNYKIIFDKVSFGYNDNLFNNLSFGIQENTSNAIIGTSGSGKSSIFKLLYKLYEPSNGNIYINNMNIKNLTNEYIQENLSIIPQNNILFNESIKYNILYSLFYKYNYNKIIDILNNEEFNNDIKKLLIKMKLQKFNIDNNIGENGSKLSGGEKQRICIARSIITNKDIILADEPFSALDKITEKKIVKELFKNRTLLTITHNPNLNMYNNIIKL